jgi:phosphocarrier protein
MGSARLVNRIGLHARPSVKLTQLAKTFAGTIEMACAANGPWINAKSPIKVMAFQAGTDALLFFRASGPGAADVVAVLVALVEDNFGEAHAGVERPNHG